MIEINLLPEEMRVEKRFYPNLDIPNIKLIVSAIILGILILAFLILSIGATLRNAQIQKLKSREEDISLQKSYVEELNKKLSILKAKTDVLDDITKRDFLWSEKLNELSDLVLPGIWFTRIYTEKEGSLIIKGSVISKKEEAMASVGKFMKNIKEDNQFFEDFNNIRLESVQRKTINERDVVDFEIVLSF